MARTPSRRAAAVATGATVMALGAWFGIGAFGESTGVSIVVPVGGSWNACYQQANPGDKCVLADGTYGSQNITRKASLETGNCDPYGEWGAVNTADCVIFEPAPGAVVQVPSGQVEVSGSNIWIRGPDPGSGPNFRSRSFSLELSWLIVWTASSADPFTHNVIVDGTDAEVLTYVLGADRVLLKNSDSGPSMMDGNCYPDQPKIAGRYGKVSNDIVLDGVFTHGYNRTLAASQAPGGGCHTGGIFMYGSTNRVTIRNSGFSANAVYDIFLQVCCGQAPPTGITIKDSWFGGTVGWSYNGQASTRVGGAGNIEFSGGGGSDILIERNKMVEGVGCAPAPPCSSGYSNVRINGNWGDFPSSALVGVPWATFSGNTWADPASLFVNITPGFEDMTLLSGEPPPTTTEPPPTTTQPPPTTTEPPPTTTQPPPAYNFNAEYDRLESSSIHQRYARYNAVEAARVESYWRNGGARPAVFTRYGTFLVNAAEAIRS